MTSAGAPFNVRPDRLAGRDPRQPLLTEDRETRHRPRAPKELTKGAEAARAVRVKRGLVRQDGLDLRRIPPLHRRGEPLERAPDQGQTLTGRHRPLLVVPRRARRGRGGA